MFNLPHDSACTRFTLSNWMIVQILLPWNYWPFVIFILWICCFEWINTFLWSVNPAQALCFSITPTNHSKVGNMIEILNNCFKHFNTEDPQWVILVNIKFKSRSDRKNAKVRQRVKKFWRKKEQWALSGIKLRNFRMHDFW